MAVPAVNIVIENVPEPYPFIMKSVEDFTKFYRETNLNMGLALDVGHAFLNGQIELFPRNLQRQNRAYTRKRQHRRKGPALRNRLRQDRLATIR
jgi:sugar phosphate isomerase/epimerase